MYKLIGYKNGWASVIDKSCVAPEFLLSHDVLEKYKEYDRLEIIDDETTEVVTVVK